MPAVCTTDGCDRPGRSRGMCNLHYQRVRAAERRSERGLAPADAPRPDLAVRVSSLRLALEEASARLRQAAIVVQSPEVGTAKGVTVAALIDEALDALDRGRF